MTDATHVDGNALGGPLIEVFGREMTDAHDGSPPGLALWMGRYARRPYDHTTRRAVKRSRPRYRAG